MDPLATPVAPPANPPHRARPLAVVMNAGSGHLDQQARVQSVREALSDREHRLWEIEDPADLDRHLRDAAAWVCDRDGALVAAGGDGTLNTVAGYAIELGCPLGVLPQGTFNYVARSHGIPVDLDASLQALRRARPVPVQVGRVNDRLFLVNASLGLYPQVLEDREAFKQQYGRYRVTAALAALRTILREHRDWLLDLDLGDRHATLRTTTIFVGNNRMQLQRLGLPDPEVVTRGLLAGVVVKPVGRWGLLGLALMGAMGRLAQASAAQDFVFRHMTVTPRHARSRRPVRVAIDGEVAVMQTPLVFQVAPRPLQLLLPDDEGEAAR